MKEVIQKSQNCHSLEKGDLIYSIKNDYYEIPNQVGDDKI